MLEILLAAGRAWPVAFLPLFVAVPIALAAGFPPRSAIFWAVLGNLSPLLIIHFGYTRLDQIKWIHRRMQRLIAPQFKLRFERYGAWFIILMIPWTGVWVMAVTAKVLGIPLRPLFVSTLTGLTAYGLMIVFLWEVGIQVLQK